MRHALSYRSDGGISDMFSALMTREAVITGATTLTKSAFGKMHLCSGTAADYTVNLPPASGAARKLIGFRMAPLASLSKLVTLDADSTQTIDGSLTRVMWAGESAILLCDGSNWFKVMGRSIPMMAGMHLSANQTGVVTATMTKALLNTSDVDNTGVMVNTGNNRIDIKRAGTYDVFGVIAIDLVGGGTSVRNLVQLRKNDSQIAFSESYTIDGFPTVPSLSKISWAVGDNVSMAGYHTKGSNAAFVGGTLAAGAAQLSVVEIPQW